MAFEITNVDVWAGGIEDRPGALGAMLAGVMQAGANFDFVIVRPVEGQPTNGVVYLAPLSGPEQAKAAEAVGLAKSSIRALRIAGPDRPGLGADIAKTLADAGINIRGLSAAAVADNALTYIRFDTEADTARAAQLLTASLG